MTLPPEQQAQILTQDVRLLLAAVQGRVVGGAVRDIIAGRKIGDIDIATPLPPDQVMATLAAQNIKSIPTGIAHGTVTAVTNRKGYEITTLRRDVQTDGRHATVAFTNDWQEDAARRDFTFNALYLDADGTISDFFGGVEDAQAGRVRFIGDAQARIKEDVLRILRFFRFFAHFGKSEPDKTALDACRELASLIPRLSFERIAHEIEKLLRAENPLPSLHLMQECGVTAQFLPEAKDLARLESLLETEKKYRTPTGPWVRLAALLPQDDKAATAVATRLKISNRDEETLVTLAKLPALLKGNLAPAALRRLIYQFGAEYSLYAIFLNGEQIAESLSVIVAWENPVFPIKGEDLLKLAMKAGPQMGEVLRRVEEWWVEKDFKPDRTACLAKAKEYTILS